MILKNTDKKNVRICMKTTQDGEVLVHNYNGTFQVKNGKKYLMYNDGFEQCSIVSEQDVVRLRRFKSGTAMVFEKDTEHISSYLTPMGALSLSVIAKTVSDKLCSAGNLVIEYLISVSETEPVKNKIHISIEEI